MQMAGTKTNADIPCRQMELLTQAKECRSARMSAVLDEFTTYQVEGSVVDYLASDG